MCTHGLVIFFSLNFFGTFLYIYNCRRSRRRRFRILAGATKHNDKRTHRRRRRRQRRKKKKNRNIWHVRERKNTQVRISCGTGIGIVVVAYYGSQLCTTVCVCERVAGAHIHRISRVPYWCTLYIARAKAFYELKRSIAKDVRPFQTTLQKRCVFYCVWMWTYTAFGYRYIHTLCYRFVCVLYRHETDRVYACVCSAKCGQTVMSGFYLLPKK